MRFLELWDAEENAQEAQKAAIGRDWALMRNCGRLTRISSRVVDEDVGLISCQVILSDILMAATNFPDVVTLMHPTRSQEQVLYSYPAVLPFISQV